MLAESFLERGLDGLTRAFDEPAWSWNRFMDGHRGASMVACYLLASESLIEPASEAPITQLVDAEWGALPLFAPRPDEPAAPAELARLLALLPAAFAQHGHSGHNVIYLTMALRALALRPDLICAGRIDGLCRMAQAYADHRPTGYPAPPPYEARAFSTWLLGEYLPAVEQTRGLTQGYTGHMLTYAQAVADLHALGHAELAGIAEAGLRRYVAEVRKDPSGEGKAQKRIDPDPARRDPATAAYWRSREVGILEASLAHCPKYAYGLLKHLRQSGDADLAERARESYYLVMS